MKKNFIKRKWLNKKGHHSTGSIYIEASELKGQFPWLQLSISDCTRTITLDFCESGQIKDKHIENAYYKLEVLRDALDEIEEGIGIIEVATKKRKKTKKKD